MVTSPYSGSTTWSGIGTNAEEDSCLKVREEVAGTLATTGGPKWTELQTSSSVVCVESKPVWVEPADGSYIQGLYITSHPTPLCHTHTHTHTHPSLVQLSLLPRHFIVKTHSKSMNDGGTPRNEVAIDDDGVM